MIIVKPCLFCKKEYKIEVSEEGYLRWKHGVLIQEAMPEISKDDRELLISGICGKCFDKMWEEKP